MESTGTEKKKIDVLSTHSDVEISASVTKTSTSTVQHLGCDHKFPPSNAEKQEKCDIAEEDLCCSQEKSENKLLVDHQLQENSSEITEAKSDEAQWSDLTENNDQVKGTVILT